LIDTSSFFDSCKLENINGRDIRIVNDSSLLKQGDYSTILVIGREMGKKMFKVEIYYFVTHAYGWVVLKQRHRKFYSVKSGISILD
jgi:hypothetical protein